LTRCEFACSVWRFGCEQSVNRRIFAAALVVGGLALLANSHVAAREFLSPSNLVRATRLTPFSLLSCFLLPLSTLWRLLQRRPCPMFITVREQQGREGRAQWFRAHGLEHGVAACLALFLALVGPLLLPFWVRLSPAKLALTRSLFFVLLPSLVISGLSTIWTGCSMPGNALLLRQLPL